MSRPPNSLSLMTGLQLCLAHYCDQHGPTPLMVTEGLPVPCTTCFDDGAANFADQDQLRPRTSAPTSAANLNQTVAMSDALRKMHLSSNRSSSLPASENEAQIQRATMLRASSTTSPASPLSPSAIETPPESPRRISDQQQPRRDSSFRRTYDDYVTKRAGPCDNCALTLPQRQSGKDKSDLKADRGPTLRTRAPYARVYGQASPPTSQASSASDTDNESQPERTHRRTAGSTTTRSSMSSGRHTSHTHYLDYTSTHEPLIPTSFSIVRSSCLRTLSLETLPRSPANPTPSASPQSSTMPAFVTTHSAGAAASGGPIFFGDPVNGYTTAYIFRIPDMHARGHKRVYAFLALSTHKERLAMKTFGFMAAAFRDLAGWIQQLAEAEAERAAEASPGGGLHHPSAHPAINVQEREGPDRGGSSFLTGGGGFTRRMGGGPGGVSLKARGLAELVGMPDFFIELHAKFVKLMLELGVVLSS
ncbi:Folliculin [Colletotrichum chlorophyti]|uniref:Folliculin n=1 Tax=Colletotrichum chlorophyti TaxID=708187 RepID=A0A1Q8S459_9PEZI|nr:Folliculin [Colletotrichum chlorophyti]